LIRGDGDRYARYSICIRVGRQLGDFCSRVSARQRTKHHSHFWPWRGWSSVGSGRGTVEGGVGGERVARKAFQPVCHLVIESANGVRNGLCEFLVDQSVDNGFVPNARGGVGLVTRERKSPGHVFEPCHEVSESCPAMIRENVDVDRARLRIARR